MRHVNFGAVHRVFVLAAVLAISVSASAPAADLKITNLATGTTDAVLLAAVAVSPRQQPYFCGFSARETAGSASSVVDIYRGVDATGVLIFSFSLAASESRSEGPWPADQCIRINEGLFIDRAGTGSTAMTVYSLGTAIVPETP